MSDGLLILGPDAVDIFQRLAHASDTFGNDVFMAFRGRRGNYGDTGNRHVSSAIYFQCPYFNGKELAKKGKESGYNAV